MVLIDAHVHLHDCFAPVEFLEQARRNFDRVSPAEHGESPIGALLLTESAGMNRFGELAAQTTALDSWRIERTAEPAALVVRSGPRNLLLIAGRQVVAREGLEVLLLGTTGTVPDGQPMREVLAEGERLGALRVIPWGAGKWLFGRGRLLSALLESARSEDGFFLGDSSGRPFFWTRPSHFAAAQRRGVRVLRGTDPLPFPHELSRVGSYGFQLIGDVDLSRPAEGIKAALRDPRSSLTPFGRLERLGPFVRHQLAMQLVKRRRVTA